MVYDRSLGCDQAAGAGLLGFLRSLSLTRPVPTEVLLRPSGSDANYVSPSKNAATLFLQGYSCSVAFLRFYICVVGFPHKSLGITMVSTCFGGVSGRFFFLEIKILLFKLRAGGCMVAK